jgi:hypothetical protein
MKLLVLSSSPVTAESLRAAVGEEDIDGAEVHVVAPALNRSAIKFWVGDSDEAIAEAQRTQEESVEALEGAGVDASGETGESEPLLALQDAVAKYDPDRIVIVDGGDELRAEAERRFGLPVIAA